MFESLFNNNCNFIKKRLQPRCFPVNIAKPLRIAFFYRTPLVAASERLKFLVCKLREISKVAFSPQIMHMNWLQAAFNHISCCFRKICKYFLNIWQGLIG